MEFGILVDAPEGVLALLAARGAAVARADRIDEHEVAEGEPAVGVVGKLNRAHRLGAVLREGRNARTDGAEMQEGRGGARAAVEGEGDRAAGAVLGHIGDVEDFRGDFAFRAEKGQRPRRGLVGERLPAERDGAVRDAVGGKLRGGLPARPGVRGLRGGLRLLRASRPGRKREHGEEDEHDAAQLLALHGERLLHAGAFLQQSAEPAELETTTL